MSTATRFVRDVPNDPKTQRQWEQIAIPWCTTHDDMASWDDLDERCWAWGRSTTEGRCVISRGGSNHKWWRDL